MVARDLVNSTLATNLWGQHPHFKLLYNLVQWFYDSLQSQSLNYYTVTGSKLLV